MSSILKALEKVEEAQNARRSGGTAGLTRRRERRPAWLIPAWAIGGAAVASLATFLAMGGFSGSRSPAPQSAAKEPSPVAVAPAPPVSAATAAPVAAKPVAPAVADTAPVAAKPAPAPAVKKVASIPTSAPTPPRATAASKRAQVPPVPVVRPAARPVALQPVPAAAAPVVAAAPPEAEPEKPRQEIRVTGIAWQGSSEASFAMINGRATRHGGTVDGYKVERIFEDGVRLSGGNGSITVPLGAGE